VESIKGFFKLMPHFRTDKVFVFQNHHGNWQPHAVVEESDPEDDTGFVADVSYLSVFSWGFFSKIRNIRKFNK
jgi:hypothetical protein